MSFLKNTLKAVWDGGASEAQAKNEANSANLPSMLATQHGLGSGYLQQMLDAIDTGHMDAKANLASAGTTATNQIIEQGKKTLAASKQGLISKGLGSTTLGANLASQTQGETSAALGSLGEKLGSLHAGLDMQHASNKAGGFMKLADFAMSKVPQANAITPQYTSGPGLAAGVGSAVGKFFGAKAGGA